MTEQWQELKETIIELRDNDGTGTQQEVCTFLVNYMDVLEKQITDDWIPCSERLPEKMGRYLCTVGANFRNPREMYYAPQEWADKSDDATWRSVDGSYVFDWFVTAWQPLPEPYKAESEDAE